MKSYPDIGQIQDMLPEPKGKYVKLIDEQNVFDIVQETKERHKEYADQYDRICKKFWKGNAFDTCKCLFDFCKAYIPYEMENKDEQTGKSPSQILQDAQDEAAPHDCKHYALFCVGVIDALKRQGYPISAFYRFASDVEKEKYPKHVFCVVPTGKGDIWVDPVLPALNQYHPYYYFLDRQPPKMAYYKVSGVTKSADSVCGFGAMSVAGPHHGGGGGRHFGGRGGGGWWGGGLPGGTTVVNTFGYEDDDDMSVGKTKKGFLNKLGQGIKKDVKKVDQAAKNLHSSVQKDVKKVGQDIKKINPGEFLMKVGMVPSRNAFLLLLKLNLFDLAYNMMKHAQTSGGEAKLKSLWSKVGGNWKDFARDVNQGYRVYMKNRKQKFPQGWHTLSGATYIGQVETAGFAGAIAAAMPVIKVFEDLFKSLGIDVTKVQNHGAAGATVVAVHHNASGKGDNDTAFGTSVKTGPNGQELHVSSFMGNQLEGASGDNIQIPGTDSNGFPTGPQGFAPAGSDNGLPSGPQGYAPGNEDYGASTPDPGMPDADVQQDVADTLAEKNANSEIPDAKSAPAKAVNVATDWMRGFKNFVENNKGVTITILSILGLVVISRSPLVTGKKRR